MKKNQFITDTVETTIFSTMGKALGFLIPFFLSVWFGITQNMDAFFFIYSIVFLLSVIFSAAMESLIVPYIKEIDTKKGDISDFVGRILGNLSIIILLLILILAFIIPFILRILTNFDKDTISLIHILFIEISPLILLLVWTSIFSGLLNAYKKFAFPAVSPAFRAIVTLIIIYLFKNRYGVHSIAWGYMAGEVIRMFILIIVVMKSNLLRIRLKVSFDKKTLGFFKTAIYSMISLVAIDTNVIIDKTMASWLEPGSVSILHYSERLYAISVTFITTGILITILSYWSDKYYANKSIKTLSEDLKKISKFILVFSISLTIVLVLNYKIITKLALARGEFPLNKLHLVGKSWLFYQLGLTPLVLSRVYVRAFLVLKKTRVMMNCAIYTVIINLALDYILMRVFGVSGIPLASTFVSFFALLYFKQIFKREIVSYK